MKIKQLIKELVVLNPELDVVIIDRDEDGWYAVRDITIVDGEDDDKLVSINMDV